LSIEILTASIYKKFPKAQIKNFAVDNNFSQKSTRAVLEGIRRNKTDVVGISIPQSTYELSIDLISSIVKEKQQTKIVLGHAIPTYSPYSFLEKFPQVIIVRGWGEESFQLLIQHFYFNNPPNIAYIPNLFYISNNQIITTITKWPNEIISPNRITGKGYFPRIEASRGCQYNKCSFCTRPPCNNGKLTSTWRRKNLPTVINEIKDIAIHGNTVFTFTDEDFVGSDIMGAIEIGNTIKQIGNLKFSLSVRADNILNHSDTDSQKLERRRLFKLLKEAGLYQVFVGLESLSNTQLKRYGKNISIKDNIKAISELKKIGINYEIGFMLFDPLLTMDELDENLSMLQKTKFWMNIGQLYNYLRPQIDSAYLNLLNKVQINNKYNPDMISYDYDFINKDINSIYHYARMWLNEFDPIYLRARSLKNNYQDQCYIDFINNIRFLQFELLKYLFINTQKKTMINLSIYNYQRRKLIEQLHNGMVKGGNNSSEVTLELNKLCEKFLAENPQ